MDDTRTAPTVDLLAGGFFLIWAAIGWLSYAGNTRLRESLLAQADPGPALLPLIVLVLISLGGAGLVIQGIARGWQGALGAGLPPPAAHALPLGFALSLGALVLALPFTGFFPAGVAYCLLWLWLLAPGGGALQWAVRLATAIGISGAIHLIFAGLLRVPLPG